MLLSPLYCWQFSIRFLLWKHKTPPFLHVIVEILTHAKRLQGVNKVNVTTTKSHQELFADALQDHVIDLNTVMEILDTVLKTDIMIRAGNVAMPKVIVIYLNIAMENLLHVQLTITKRVKCCVVLPWDHVMFPNIAQGTVRTVQVINMCIKGLCAEMHPDLVIFLSIVMEDQNIVQVTDTNPGTTFVASLMGHAIKPNIAQVIVAIVLQMSIPAESSAADLQIHVMFLNTVMALLLHAHLIITHPLVLLKVDLPNVVKNQVRNHQRGRVKNLRKERVKNQVRNHLKHLARTHENWLHAIQIIV